MSSPGWRIAKEKAGQKLDVIVAPAQAALGAVEQRGASRMLAYDFQTGEPVALAMREPGIPNFEVGFVDPDGKPIRTEVSR